MEPLKLLFSFYMKVRQETAYRHTEYVFDFYAKGTNYNCQELKELANDKLRFVTHFSTLDSIFITYFWIRTKLIVE